MKLILQILLCIFAVSCKSQNNPKTEIAKQENTEYKTTSSSKNSEPNSCESKVQQTINDFLSLQNIKVTWQDENYTLPCWLKSIENGDTIIENILISRLAARVEAIKNNDYKYINTYRIIGDIYAKAPSKRLLDIAMEYASIDSCVHYQGEGSVHYGYLGLANLLEITDEKYKKSYFDHLNILLFEENDLDKFNEYSCEHIELLYKYMFDFVQNDYKNNLISLKSRNEMKK